MQKIKMSLRRNFLIGFFMTLAFLKFHPSSRANEDPADLQTNRASKSDLSESATKNSSAVIDLLSTNKEKVNNQCNPDSLDDRLTERASTHIPPEAYIRASDRVCLGQTMVLKGSDSRSRDHLPLKYDWDFGDGTQDQGMTVDKKFEKAKTYHVTLTVQDSSGSVCNRNTAQKDIQVIDAPVAVAGENISVCLGEGIEFQGSSTNKDTIAHFAQWNFGDGRRERGLKVRHVYGRPGTYHATLTLQDPFTLDCPESTAQRTVKVYPSPEIALNASDRVIGVNQEVFFDAHFFDSSLMGPNPKEVKYFWNFGEGDSIFKSGPQASHLFTKPGTYKVAVIVDDDKGTACSTNSASLKIQVHALPEDQKNK